MTNRYETTIKVPVDITDEKFEDVPVVFEPPITNLQDGNLQHREVVVGGGGVEVYCYRIPPYSIAFTYGARTTIGEEECHVYGLDRDEFLGSKVVVPGAGVLGEDRSYVTEMIAGGMLHPGMPLNEVLRDISTSSLAIAELHREGAEGRLRRALAKHLSLRTVDMIDVYSHHEGADNVYARVSTAPVFKSELLPGPNEKLSSREKELVRNLRGEKEHLMLFDGIAGGGNVIAALFGVQEEKVPGLFELFPNLLECDVVALLCTGLGVRNLEKALIQFNEQSGREVILRAHVCETLGVPSANTDFYMCGLMSEAGAHFDPHLLRIRNKLVPIVACMAGYWSEAYKSPLWAWWKYEEHLIEDCGMPLDYNYFQAAPWEQLSREDRERLPRIEDIRKEYAKAM